MHPQLLRTPHVKAFEGSAAELVSGMFRSAASRFTGTYRLLCGGKLGEIFFVGGLVADLRRQLPSTRLLLDCWPQYAFMANSLRNRFDAVTSERTSLYFQGRGIHRTGRELSVDVFRGSPSSPGPPAFHAPFYRVFAKSTGCAFQVPAFIDDIPVEPIALALPTMNHNASARGKLPFSPDQWQSLAGILQGSGIRCVATGSPSDPAPGPMPGWEWVAGGMTDAIALIRRSRIVIGGNSGVVFMAGALGKKVVMLNDIASELTSWWDPRGMTDVPSMAAIRYMRLRPTGQDDAASFPFTQAALTDFCRSA